MADETTRRGTRITDELADELAREAEAGYDLDDARRVDRRSDVEVARPAGYRTLAEVRADRPHVSDEAIAAESQRARAAIERAAAGDVDDDDDAHRPGRPTDPRTLGEER